MEPDYIQLWRSGELLERARRLEERLHHCDLCPHRCGVDRCKGSIGRCRSGYRAIVASFCDHHGEEPPLSGSRGSGTIFFGNCNLSCVFCQNYQISQPPRTKRLKEVTSEELARIMLHLQNDLGCHNINLVSPTHFVPQIIQALLLSIPAGLRVPLVYNTNAYDLPETLQELDGVIDIYLPDFKYASDIAAQKYSRAPGYSFIAKAAIKEMYRQVGNLVIGPDDIARSGLIIRHLVLPDGIAGSDEVLSWIAQELSPQVTVSLMSQYKPSHHAYMYPELNRNIFPAEYQEVMRLANDLGLENGWFQEVGSAEEYLPDFEREGRPFL